MTVRPSLCVLYAVPWCTAIWTKKRIYAGTMKVSIIVLVELKVGLQGLKQLHDIIDCEVEKLQTNNTSKLDARCNQISVSQRISCFASHWNSSKCLAVFLQMSESLFILIRVRWYLYQLIAKGIKQSNSKAIYLLSISWMFYWRIHFCKESTVAVCSPD